MSRLNQLRSFLLEQAHQLHERRFDVATFQLQQPIFSFTKQRIGQLS